MAESPPEVFGYNSSISIGPQSPLFTLEQQVWIQQLIANCMQSVPSLQHQQECHILPTPTLAIWVSASDRYGYLIDTLNNLKCCYSSISMARVMTVTRPNRQLDLFNIQQLLLT